MIIGLSGYAGSGKDTAANIIQTLEQKVWNIKKFSGKLKQIASILTGIPEEKFEDQEFKKSELPKEWNLKYNKHLDSTYANTEVMTVRTFLQKLGTDAIRDGLHPNAWVNALMSEYKPLAEDPNWFTLMPVYPRWIITDVRFPNEAQAIKDRGGEIWRIVRGEKVNDHPSETSLDHWNFDRTVHNTGTIDEFTRSLSEAFRHFKRQNYA